LIWKDEYRVGVKTLDDQHRTILGIINELYNAKRDKTKSTVVWQSLVELKNYALTHLADEERMMEKCGYADFENHRKAHDYMRAKTEELVRMHQGNAGDISFDLLDFLKEWWTQHIIVTDHKYIGCLVAK